MIKSPTRKTGSTLCHIYAKDCYLGRSYDRSFSTYFPDHDPVNCKISKHEARFTMR